jgi:hypothetical protein
MLALQSEVYAKICHPLGLPLRSSKRWGYGRCFEPGGWIGRRRWPGLVGDRVRRMGRSFGISCRDGSAMGEMRKRPLAGSFWAVPA